MIGVLDYGAGNIRSISRGLAAAGTEVFVAEHGRELVNTDAIVLPGVGHAGQLMKALQSREMDTAILDAVASGTPFLGICVGLQIMFGDQEEGNTRGLGLLSGEVPPPAPFPQDAAHGLEPGNRDDRQPLRRRWHDRLLLLRA